MRNILKLIIPTLHPPFILLYPQLPCLFSPHFSLDHSCCTCADVVLFVVGQVGTPGQHGAQAVLVADAEEYSGPLQHQVFDPLGHMGLQVLLVNQPHD